TESRLAIKTDNILGKKVLEIEPRGTHSLRPGAVLPLSQSTIPYQLYDAGFDITKAAAGWDIDTIKRSLNVLSQNINQTSPRLSATLDGLTKFSDTIAKRDEQIKHLLAQAHQLASVLGDRSEQIDRLLVNANTLLAAFNQRGRAIDALLHNISDFSADVQNFINDNPSLNPVLEQLHVLSDLLVERKADLAQSLTSVGQFAASLGESVASGPYFKIVLSNLLPYWI
ncbi:MCE family protein, partial [Mycobacterium sp. E2733]|uniref:MCE family protein n=1 Tax=Mycobacterium sp. E2733 TaxID=1834138 RepID=UPI000B02DF56